MHYIRLDASSVKLVGDLDFSVADFKLCFREALIADLLPYDIDNHISLTSTKVTKRRSLVILGLMVITVLMMIIILFRKELV